MVLPAEVSEALFMQKRPFSKILNFSKKYKGHDVSVLNCIRKLSYTPFSWRVFGQKLAKTVLWR